MLVRVASFAKANRSRDSALRVLSVPCTSGSALSFFHTRSQFKMSESARPKGELPATAFSSKTVATGAEASRSLYPYDSAPYDTGYLERPGGHRVYYEQWGNPKGKPAVVLHGGPGGGCNEKMRGFFDGSKYRVVLFDQRGAGRSTPFATLEGNTTWDLVGDIEALREHVGLEKWLVWGGSWGSTLALAYAETHPERVTELILRGIFLVREAEINAFYQDACSGKPYSGAVSTIFPDAWEQFLAPIPEEERKDLVAAYYKRLTGTNEEEQMRCAKAWSIWEGVTSKLLPDPDYASTFTADKFALAFARIENHYFYNKGFFSSDDYLVENVGKIRHIPAVIVGGRYDVVCHHKSHYDLAKAWPEADSRIVPDAGHSAYEKGIMRELLDASDRFADRT